MNIDQARESYELAKSMLLDADSSQGPNDVYLKLEGIEGESQDDKHKGEIEIIYYDFNEWQQGSSGSGGGSGASRPTFENIHITSAASKAGPKLFNACVKGERIAKATISCRKSGGGQQDFLVWKLSDVVIYAYGMRIDEKPDGTLLVTDNFSLNYAQIEVEYRPQKPDGSLGSPSVFTFDLRGQ